MESVLWWRREGEGWGEYEGEGVGGGQVDLVCDVSSSSCGPSSSSPYLSFSTNKKTHLIQQGIPQFLIYTIPFWGA